MHNTDLSDNWVFIGFCKHKNIPEEGSIIKSLDKIQEGIALCYNEFKGRRRGFQPQWGKTWNFLDFIF